MSSRGGCNDITVNGGGKVGHVGGQGNRVLSEEYF